MHVTNTLSGRKEEFRPAGETVRMYVCGVTPYSETHIGHVMSYVIFDVIKRYLRYRGYGVRHVQNFTDVDDKIIARANQNGETTDALTERYIADPYRRRLLLTLRKIVVLTALVLVVVMHFASELTTLLTVLGFAAAGIAFALQTVILAVAGYFSMMAPNGIRVGDRVSLQGPFGYVNGEVLEIGFVRIRLRELAGDPPAATGRTVVFPNSVVFTGSFFKHPGGSVPEPPDLERAA